MFKSGIGFNYNVSDLEGTLAFYTKKLGFQVLSHDVAQGQARLATANRECFIGFAESQSVFPSSTCTTFEVENIEQAVQILKEKGVEFDGGIIEIPNAVKLATFTDPDGYKLMLFSQV